MKTNKHFLRGTLLPLAMLLVAAHVFGQTYADITKNLTDNFILYERYLPNNQLNQLRAIRNRIMSKPDEATKVIDTMRDFINECDNTAHQNLLARLSEMGQKDERLSSYQNTPEVQELHRRFETLYTKAQSLSQVRNDIGTVDSLYDAIDRQYAELVLASARSVAGSGVTQSSYVIQEGDTLRAIAMRVYGDETKWREIYNVNLDLIQNPDFILANKVLRLPGSVVPQALPPGVDLSDSGYGLGQASPVTPSSVAPVSTSNTWYVRAGGNDNNNGFTSDSAFKTLAQAVKAASSGTIKTITIIGELEINNARDVIKDTGDAEIIISGGQTGNAILTPWDSFCSVTVQGRSNIRFERITIQNFDNGGLVVQDATVTLGAGTQIVGNNSYGGGGLRIRNGRVIMQNGAEIVNNEYTELYENMGGHGAGVELNGGSFTMMAGSRIAGNIAHGFGGGVYVAAGTFIMRGGNISGNQSKRAKGGGVYVAGGSFEISGGDISGNIGETGDAVYVAQAGSFSNRGGAIAANIVNERNLGSTDQTTPLTGSPTSTVKYEPYTVQPGQYLRMIATLVYGDEMRWRDIYNENQASIINPDFLLPDTVLQIPRIGFEPAITQTSTLNVTPQIQPLPQISAAAMYYVKATGKDTDSGLSETEPFKTLARAVNAASGSSIKKVLVIGTLELSDMDTLTIQNTGAEEIIVSGKANAPAILKRNTGSEWWKTLTVKGNSNIRFEYITITGGSYGGLVLQEAAVTLGPGARVSGNFSANGGGGGVYITNGKLTMLDGAEISNNSSRLNPADERTGYGAGVLLESGSFTMSGGSITGNSAETVGGGVYVAGGSFVMTDGRIAYNSSASAGGAVYVMDGSFVMTGAGVIEHNVSQYGGGVYAKGGTAVMVSGSISGNVGDYGAAVYVALNGSFKQFGGEINGSIENTSVIDATDSTVSVGSGSSSYYVRADGNDANDGTRENAPFKTLTRAIAAVTQSGVKVITVIGAMEGATRIENAGELEILITGKAQASASQKAVFNGEATEPVFDISGLSKIRVEHIAVSADAGGAFKVLGNAASLTLGTGTRITGKADTLASGVFVDNDATLIMRDNASVSSMNTLESAVYVAKGTFTMTDNALISRNSTQGKVDGGGVYIRNGVFTMQGNASISGNRTAANGGGVCIDQGSFIMQENARIADNTALGYGGGVFMNLTNQPSTFAMRDTALISGNTANLWGGGVYVIGTMTLSGNARVADNTALFGGGVVISSNSALTLRETAKIIANRATGDGSFGGGVLGLDKTSKLTLGGAALLSGNVADYGGGAATYGAIVSETNAEITANRAIKGGGGIVFLFQGADNVKEEDTTLIKALLEKVSGNIAPDPKEAEIALRVLN